MNVPPSADLPSSLIEAWSRTDVLFLNEVTESRALEQPISLRHPFIFYLGHLPAFAINTARLASTSYPEAALLLLSVSEKDIMFSRGIDPDTDDPSLIHAHPARPQAYPTWNEVLTYRDTVRGALCSIATLLPCATFTLIAEHDFMHIETLYYMLAQSATLRISPIPVSKELREVRNARTIPSQTNWITIPEGPAHLGLCPGGSYSTGEIAGSSFAWDNEFPETIVATPSFQLAEFPVTVAQYYEFIAAGGYTKSQFWTSDATDWIKREGVAFPASWRRAGDGSFDVVTVDGIVRASDAAAWPVSVCLAEARAYATWKNVRIMSEAEWDRASCEGGGISEGNFGFKARRPVDIGVLEKNTGKVRELAGNGWELVDTLLEKEEGWEAMRLYPEYSSDFFDGKHFILKGASWATSAALVRKSFRNFYQSRYPFVFSKFRLARDVI